MKKLGLILFFFFFSSLVFAQDKQPLSESDAETYYSQALTLASAGRAADAVQTLHGLTSRGFTNVYIYYSLLDISANWIAQEQSSGNADSEQTKKLLTAARADATEALKIYPDDKKILYRYSDFSRNLSDYQEFYNALQKILSLNSEDIFGNYYMGAYYYINRDFAKAKDYFQNVIANPVSSQDFEMMAIYNSYFNLGIISAGEQNYQVSVQYLEKANEIYSRNIELTRALAFTYAEILDFSHAAAYFKQIPENLYRDDVISAYGMTLYLTKDPAFKVFFQTYGQETPLLRALDFYQKKDYDNAVKQVEKHFVDSQNADYFGQYLLYQIYSTNGDHEKADQMVFQLGTRAKNAGQYDLAVSYFLKLEKNPKSLPDLYWLVGSIYDDKEDNSNAIIYYRKYIASPEAKEYKNAAIIRLAYLYSKTGEKKKADAAVKQAKKSAVTKQDLYQVYYYSGLVNVENKNFPAAIADFESALTSKTNDARLYFFLGAAYFENKNQLKAISYLETGRNFEQNLPEMNNLLAYLYSLEKIKLDEAVKIANLAILAQPENVAYLDTLGWIYFQQNEIQKSFEIFGHVAAILEKNPSQEGRDEIYYHLGMVYEKMGNPEKAWQYYQIGLDANPKNELLKKKVKK